MIGSIAGIDGNTVLVKLSLKIDEVQSLINLYVIMEDSIQKVIGEITDIKDGMAYINMVGEIKDEHFVPGITKKPSFGATIKLIAPNKINFIVGVEDYQDNKDLYIGKSPLYEGVDVCANINSLFANHFAIFGSTGSGKSCGFSRIMQNLFEKKTTVAYRSSIFVFDAYGEYHNAFKTINDKAPEATFKAYTTNIHDKTVDTLKIPLWLLGVDDFAILLGADKHSHIPIIEKALKFVTIFGRAEEEVIQYKNDIIARALLDIILSGRPAPQIRDQVFSVLSTYNTKDLNLESPVFQPGYIRPLKQCLLIDASGKIREIELLTNFIESFLVENVELSLPDGSFKYTLKDLCLAFDFALIDEGSLKSEAVFDMANTLKVRLHGLLDSEYAVYFDCPEYISRDDYIKSLTMTPDGKKIQLINFNINYVDDRFAKTITKIYSKMLFDYAKGLPTRASFPFHIILEEAHRYVQKDIDVELLGYNIFERITKEGRKYGVLLGLISQRPSEMSETALSQCSNFFIFKMLHPLDVKYIHDMVPEITDEVIKKMKTLQPGNCMAFGSAFKLPTLIRLDMPNPSPSSSSCDISSIWFIDRKRIEEQKEDSLTTDEVPMISKVEVKEEPKVEVKEEPKVEEELKPVEPVKDDNIIEIIE